MELLEVLVMVAKVSHGFTPFSYKIQEGKTKHDPLLLGRRFYYLDSLVGTVGEISEQLKHMEQVMVDLGAIGEVKMGLRGLRNDRWVIEAWFEESAGDHLFRTSRGAEGRWSDGWTGTTCDLRKHISGSLL